MLRNLGSFAKKEYFVLFVVISVNIALLVYLCSNLSISYDEAKVYFGGSSFLRSHGFLHELTGLSVSVLGGILGLDFALRAPFLCAHIINIYLFYLLSRNILIGKTDSIISAIIFMYLPGVLASAVLVNSAVFIIMLSLGMVLCIQKERNKTLIILLALSIFISNAFGALYLALFLYGLYIKRHSYSVIAGVFLLIWLFVFNFDISGKPRGYLLDSMAVYAAVFSPLVFIYFIYSFYRIWVKERKDFLWFVSAVAFCASLIISVRTKAVLEAFLPFCVIFVPHMLRLFLVSLRVRLPQFRIKYKLLGSILAFSLAAQVLLGIFNAPLYLLFNNAQDHFIYDYDIAKELANRLKSLGVRQIFCSDKELRLRLRFYGIKSSFDARLSEQKCSLDAQKIIIKKLNKKIALFYLCK